MKLYVVCISMISVLYSSLLTCSDSHRSPVISKQWSFQELSDLELLGRAVLARTKERDHLALQLKRVVYSIHYSKSYILQLRDTIDALKTNLEQQQQIAQEKNTTVLQQLALVTLERNALMDERDSVKKERDYALQKVTELESEKKNERSQSESPQNISRRSNRRIAMLCHMWSEQQRQRITTTLTSPDLISQVTSQEKKTQFKPNNHQQRTRGRRPKKNK